MGAVVDEREAGGLGEEPSPDVHVPAGRHNGEPAPEHREHVQMTDRRRTRSWWRAWRATFGRLCPAVRRLRARRVWEWWTATGVIPRWQLLLVYMFVTAAGAVGMTSTRDVADRADRAAIRADELARNVRADRIGAIRISCEQQNLRNMAMVDLLQKLNPMIDPKVAQQFADAGWPRYDCDERVRELSGG